MTKAITRRIRRLEDRFGSASGKAFLVVTSCVTLALEADTCVQILRECGFVPTGGIGVVNLCKIPDGLNAEEIKLHLRKHGAELCTPPPSGCRTTS
jgi:hypothetical protein